MTLLAVTREMIDQMYGKSYCQSSHQTVDSGIHDGARHEGVIGSMNDAGKTTPDVHVDPF